MAQLKSKYRTHTCGELREAHVGQDVKLSGWILRKRNHGGVLFIDLRDNYGVTQVVCSAESVTQLEHIRIESVVLVEGKVVARQAQLINSNLETGAIEVQAAGVEVLAAAEVLPFQIADDDGAPEAIRLKSRFLELRREKLHKNIIKRSAIINEIRSLMCAEGFTEFQTPILTSSSPEGARDFVVPSRLHPGKFYALPQAPQQFKQLLMVSGFDRYFQIAPCFRDEDSRADRSPGEFYQLDLEMSFVEQEDVLQVNERVISALWKKFSDLPMLSEPFQRIPYLESIERFGSDKPDLRNPLEIKDCSAVFAGTTFRVFAEVLANGGTLRAIKVPVKEVPSRKVCDDLVDFFSKLTGQGLAYLNFEGTEVKGSIQKFVSPEEADAMRKLLAIDGTSLVLIAAGKPKVILPALGKLRDKVGQDFGLVDTQKWAFCWIIDFPMYEEGETPGSYDFVHNPFSMPQGGLNALAEKDPLEILANQYDLVCNGYELGSGSIRNHITENAFKAFEIVGYKREDVEQKFSGLLRAFSYGVPPHGGFAHGVERIVMLLCGEQAIREVITFPLAQTGEDLMMAAPSELTPKQLREVHIALKLPEKSL
jgi:aspartyl-tRNA synthetase